MPINLESPNKSRPVKSERKAGLEILILQRLPMIDRQCFQLVE